MKNKFKVNNAFYLSSNNFLILEGDILQGTLRKGMKFVKAGRTIIVNSVDYADKIDNSYSTIIKIIVENEKAADELCRKLNKTVLEMV